MLGKYSSDCAVLNLCTVSNQFNIETFIKFTKKCVILIVFVYWREVILLNLFIVGYNVT